jgi:hypothetical protein
VVVDTNVPLAANGANQPTPECIAATTAAIGELLADRARLALDGGRRILEEYGHKLRPAGHPGIGDRFLKWVLINQANPGRCELVRLTPRQDDRDDFEEFPRARSLARFDRSDRKFVAVAAAHPGRPPILQALDSKWWGFRTALEECGILVEFLCPADIERLFRRRRRRPRV